MPEDFLIAKNPESGTTLPFLVRIPLPGRPVVLKVKDTWPRTSKVYCHRTEWPTDVEIIDRIPTRSCEQRGAAIDLILDRPRENRSQFVLTQARGREAIFWQTARTTKQARPGVRTPKARASGQASFEIIVDIRERYAWTFSEEQVTTARRPLPVGDYAVERDNKVLAAVERKSLNDLVATLTTGKLRYLMADLAALPRAALVVEDRYSSIFGLTRVRPATVADGIAEAQVRFPQVPIIFTETRALAQQWTYRFFGACLSELTDTESARPRVDELSTGPEMPPRMPTTAEIRVWALTQGLPVSPRGGRIAADIVDAYNQAHAVGT